jgi:hypothetical protein
MAQPWKEVVRISHSCPGRVRGIAELRLVKICMHPLLRSYPPETSGSVQYRRRGYSLIRLSTSFRGGQPVTHGTMISHQDHRRETRLIVSFLPRCHSSSGMLCVTRGKKRDRGRNEGKKRDRSNYSRKSVGMDADDLPQHRICALRQLLPASRVCAPHGTIFSGLYYTGSGEICS